MHASPRTPSALPARLHPMIHMPSKGTDGGILFPGSGGMPVTDGWWYLMDGWAYACAYSC
eukprot:6401055-Prymnesium_polylepis.1